MAKPNYSFEKRQRELLKKQKKEQKLAQRRSADGKATAPAEEGADSSAPVAGTDPQATPATPA